MDSHGKLAVVTLVLLVLAATAITPTRAQVLAKPGCPAHCGNLSIPYPFGTKEGCFLNENFRINCNDLANYSRAYLSFTDFVVTNISMEGQLQIWATVARDCYDISGDRVIPQITSWFPFLIYNVSNTRNKFTAIGCDTFAYLNGFVGNKSYSAGCMSLCDRFEDLVDGSCSGFGCCQIQIPDGLKSIDVRAYSFNNHINVSDFNLCSYAFIVEESEFQFSSDYVRSIPEDYKFPVSLDWVVSNETCEEAAKNPLNYTCHRSECYEPGIGMGYLCKCSDGFDGNPYLPEGCLDIDECKISSPCDQNASCYNSPGSFKCICRGGYEGDGKINGTGCSLVHETDGFPFVNIGLGVSISLLVLLLSISWIYWGLWKRKLIRQREKFFQQNGGIILQQEFSKHKAPVSAKIFTSEELKKATNNYHESRILGQGGHGTVYKGILQDKRVVAIKKSMIADNSQVEQFINEVIVLSQVNHRNVVKLLGCCLETEVPLLVYEFISNGTLYQHLHTSGLASFRWESRLRIAAETAGALSYLHSAAYPPIIHRDVKSTNILLDDHYTAKVSDFGASRLVPLDQTQLTTLVQGTLGYLDPEYFQSSQLTEKSDVHSFGVVLVELLTGRKALCFQMPEEERNLAMHFVSALKKDRLFKIVDHHVLLEENSKQIKEVAMLAKKCLRVRGEERPSMKEVAMELEGLRAIPKHPWVKDDSKETTEYLLGELSGANAQGVSISLLVLLLSISWIYWGLWQRKLIRQREKFFQQNGGIILQQEFSKHKAPVSAKIFTSEELKKATNNYHESRILGQGGHGTVYKGILQDKRVVAIKKSMIADNSQVEQFINEVIVLSQVNHRNVVKLLGCCLETEVPLLVYEFISNGTLYQHLHTSGLASFRWESRLRIAAETAGALSYLHSAAYPPIIHRDVKSTNILLDDHYTAKVSDFGASRLVPLDQTQLTTLVQGTLGYLDPEYFQSSQLTEKSDVYSFGVVLVELLTGRKALCFQMPEEERNLAMHFVSALKKDRLFKIVDHHVLLEENSKQIKEVAMLAKKCLRVRGEERPSMKEVAMELEGLRAIPKHPWVKDDSKETTEYLLGELSGANAQGNDSNPSGYDSNRQQIILHGR